VAKENEQGIWHKFFLIVILNVRGAFNNM